jgi:hypothetical protein
MRLIKSKFYTNVQIVEENSKEKHMPSMFPYVPESSKIKKKKIQSP